MDERRTLTLLGWSLGGIVGAMFLLNAIALASLQSAPIAKPDQLASRAGKPAVPTVTYGVSAKGNS